MVRSKRHRDSDDDSEMEDVSRTKADVSKRKNDESEEEAGEEDEYEIEAILDAKHGAFGGVRVSRLTSRHIMWPHVERVLACFPRVNLDISSSGGAILKTIIVG